MANFSSMLDEIPDELLGAGPSADTLPWTRKKIDYSTIGDLTDEERETAKKGLGDFLQKYKGPEADSSTARLNLIRLQQYGTPQFDAASGREDAGRVSNIGKKSHAASVAAIQDDLGQPFDADAQWHSDFTPIPKTGDAESIAASRKAPIMQFPEESVAQQAPEAAPQAAPFNLDALTQLRQNMSQVQDPFKSWVFAKAQGGNRPQMGFGAGSDNTGVNYNPENVSVSAPAPAAPRRVVAGPADARVETPPQAPAGAEKPILVPTHALADARVETPPQSHVAAQAATPVAQAPETAPTAQPAPPEAQKEEPPAPRRPLPIPEQEKRPDFVDASMNAQLQNMPLQDIISNVLNGSVSPDSIMSLVNQISKSYGGLGGLLGHLQQAGLGPALGGLGGPLSEANNPNSRANQQVRPEDVNAQNMYHDTKDIFRQAAGLGGAPQHVNPWVQAQENFRNWVKDRASLNQTQQRMDAQAKQDAAELEIKRSLAATKAKNAASYANLTGIQKAELAGIDARIPPLENQYNTFLRERSKFVNDELQHQGINPKTASENARKNAQNAYDNLLKGMQKELQSLNDRRDNLLGIAPKPILQLHDKSTSAKQEGRADSTAYASAPDTSGTDASYSATRDAARAADAASKARLAKSDTWDVVGTKLKLRDYGQKKITDENRKKATDIVLASNAAFDASKELVSALNGYGKAIQSGKDIATAKSILDASIKNFGEKMSIANGQGVVTDGEIATLNRIYSPLGISFNTVNDFVSSMGKIGNIIDVWSGDPSSIKDMEKAASSISTRIKTSTIKKLTATNLMELVKIPMEKDGITQDVAYEYVDEMKKNGWKEVK